MAAKGFGKSVEPAPPTPATAEGAVAGAGGGGTASGEGGGGGGGGLGSWEKEYKVNWYQRGLGFVRGSLIFQVLFETVTFLRVHAV